MALTLVSSWPKDDDCKLVKVGGRDMYRTPDGDFRRVTSITGFSGMGKEGLMGWAARVERDAAIMAVEKIVFEAAESGVQIESPEDFRAAVLARMGPAKAHVLEKDKAADIGTRAHEMASWVLRGRTGQERGLKPSLRASEDIAFGCWQRWWEGSGLTPVRSEQRLWSVDLEVAGTIDFIAENKDGFGVVDFKFSTGIYRDYHLQVAAYVELARQYVPVSWAKIVRFAKYENDPLLKGNGWEERDLGDVGYTTKGGKKVDSHIPADELLNGFILLRDFHEIMG